MGLSFVRQQNLVHRDLHPGNILNDRYGDGDGDGFDRSFITDVEPCRPTNYREKEGEIFGIPPYVAPEVILGQPYTPASDIYSFGIVAYELFANAYPHLDYDFGNKIICKIFFDQVVNEELRPNIDEIPLPKEIKDLITRCWNADPAKRPTAQELYRTLEKEYNHFSKNTSYRINPTSVVASIPINTNQITESLKKACN
ncbi:11130_t:CDS:2 [Funneliformis geosporum]|uniref:11130_t:CDS:1 n=1 Tax=Funneliformis geosporum TaxID=1117311 RepID=A0A9W4SLL6_9GLOM|nr:11130_t:CDS:2 [Funneliformis geosporum]